MPYKDPENKRVWEQEHRKQRNARRRQRRSEVRTEPAFPKRVPDPVPAKQSASGWKVVSAIGVFVLAVGLALLGSTSPLPRQPAN
jgi:hypothetical protein